MTERAQAVEFHTSAIGRFAWACMMLISLFVLSFLGMGFHAGGRGVFALHWAIIALLALFTIVGLWSFLLAFLFALWPGWRLRCDAEGIRFIGLLGPRSLNWSQIESFRVGSAGNSYSDTLELRVAGRWRPYRLNVTGLKPDYLELERTIGRLIRPATA